MPLESEPITSNQKKPRIYWVDNAKAIGIILVYYLHFIMIYSDWGNNEIAYNQSKFIFAFVIQLFFFMSGFFWKRSRNSFSQEFKRLFFRRLIPVFFFGALMIPFWVAASRFGIETYWHGVIDIKWVLSSTLLYFSGYPALNGTTWFLVCLFTCEILAFWFLPLFPSKRMRFLFGIFAVGIGFFVISQIFYFENYFGVLKNTWYVHESIMALGFYAIGSAMRPIVERFSTMSMWIKLTAFITSAIVTLSTFSMNNPSEDFWVVLGFSEHGEFIPFIVTSISGIAFILSISMLIPRTKTLLFFGVNTIALIGLNGIFQHILNPIIYRSNVPFDLNSVLGLTIFCMIQTALSLMLCVPVILFLNKYLPQVVGKTFVDGPILPNLEKIEWGRLISKNVQATKNLVLNWTSPSNG